MLRLHGLSAYGTGKSAINRLAEFIDLEYRDQGVRAFAFHPGKHSLCPHHSCWLTALRIRYMSDEDD
jgi:NAD(P)-dependent dehydrogenase (short-subunit alcohol dehydrogenase family)